LDISLPVAVLGGAFVVTSKTNQGFFILWLNRGVESDLGPAPDLVEKRLVKAPIVPNCLSHQVSIV
jgi:hypothetical protein